ncbi:hypothetical protein FHX44_118110 [Pseudonocardia hierapolitana]|uniref:Uncharacterized protein n=1 Tax=Pseudonocardia hierapolitana TaxID=1128676 RepID=A0A561T4Y2_9PSEU|nr:hypothetical protein FHX44_118110 [Pseudonocardia hierapolitana]
MKASVIKGIGHVGFMEKEVPQPGPVDAAVRTTRALIGTSDSQTLRRPDPRARVQAPPVLGWSSRVLAPEVTGLSPDRGNRCYSDIAGVGRFPTLHSRNSKGAVSR